LWRLLVAGAHLLHVSQFNLSHNETESTVRDLRTRVWVLAMELRPSSVCLKALEQQCLGPIAVL
jgi:hypothetical protein